MKPLRPPTTRQVLGTRGLTLFVPNPLPDSGVQPPVFLKHDRRPPNGPVTRHSAGLGHFGDPAVGGASFATPPDDRVPRLAGNRTEVCAGTFVPRPEVTVHTVQRTPAMRLDAERVNGVRIRWPVQSRFSGRRIALPLEPGL